MIKLCECGCEEEIESQDRWGRERMFIKGHNHRGNKYVLGKHWKIKDTSNMYQDNGFKKGEKCKNWNGFKKGQVSLNKGKPKKNNEI